MASTEDTLAVVREVFEAFDARDLDRFRALLAADAVLVVGGGPQAFEGPDAMAAAVGATLEALPPRLPRHRDAGLCGRSARRGGGLPDGDEHRPRPPP